MSETSSSVVESPPRELPPMVYREPTLSERFFDRFFRGLTWGLAWMTVVLVVGMVVLISVDAWPTLRDSGGREFYSVVWDANRNEFGILTHIWGTLYSSLLALLLGGTLGVAVAIFIAEDFLPSKIRLFLKNLIELLAAIPSVIYGLWGIHVVIPALRAGLHYFPSLLADFSGPSMLSASLVLAIMILPTVTALSRDALESVPPRLREGAYGLGATRWETIRKIVLPTACTGILGAIILAFGRALGETMALAMLVGNSTARDNPLSFNPLLPGQTLAALLANNFPEASDPLQVGALMMAALVLLLITLVVNLFGALIIWRASAQFQGLRS